MTDEVHKNMIKKIEEIVKTGKDIKLRVSQLIDSSFNQLLSEVATE